MNSNRNTVGIVLRIFGGIFAGVGLLLLVIGGLLYHGKTQKLSYYEQTTAVISWIDRYRDADGDTHHTPYLDYTVNGTRYEDMPSNTYTSSMRVGGEVTIAYDPADPASFFLAGRYTHLATYILCGIGGVFLVIGLVPVGISIALKKREIDPYKGPEV